MLTVFGKFWKVRSIFLITSSRILVKRVICKISPATSVQFASGTNNQISERLRRAHRHLTNTFCNRRRDNGITVCETGRNCSRTMCVPVLGTQLQGPTTDCLRIPRRQLPLGTRSIINLKDCRRRRTVLKYNLRVSSVYLE